MGQEKIWFKNNKIFLKTKDNVEKSMPLSWFPRLENASREERQNYTLSPFGIHWQELDEDLSFEGFFKFDKNQSKIDKH
jgi:hypothetical protein